ncbi:MAG: hypothetical protein ACJ786_23650 [Catenulispora sp.]|jgi:hypothetical protein
MKIALDPIAHVIEGLAADIAAGRRVLTDDRMPGYPTTATLDAAVALDSASRAVAALRAVLAALGDLEPVPALVVNDALRTGLGVNW